MIRYFVKTNDDKKYLRENISKYGSSLNLTEDILLAKQFTSVESARQALITYLKDKKKVTAKDLMIDEIEIIYKPLDSIPALPKSEQLNLWGYGIVTNDDLTRVTKEWISNNLQNKYLVTPKSFDYEIVNKTQPLYENNQNSPTINLSLVNVSNIIWEE